VRHEAESIGRAPSEELDARERHLIVRPVSRIRVRDQRIDSTDESKRVCRRELAEAELKVLRWRVTRERVTVSGIERRNQPVMAVIASEALQLCCAAEVSPVMAIGRACAVSGAPIGLLIKERQSARRDARDTGASR
jgi:hypothetical protein